jgi:hypothetical protein
MAEEREVGEETRDALHRLAEQGEKQTTLLEKMVEQGKRTRLEGRLGILAAIAAGMIAMCLFVAGYSVMLWRFWRLR